MARLKSCPSETFASSASSAVSFLGIRAARQIIYRTELQSHLLKEHAPMSTARNIIGADATLPDQQLNQQILSGDFQGAFEKFYADDVVMQENEEAPRKGKTACRQFEEEFIASVEKVNSSKLLGSAVNGDTSFSEWEYDMTFKGGNRVKMTQVSARRWQNGKVIHERFYYNKAA
jgi:ketosteroid isomerase-like protein